MICEECWSDAYLRMLDRPDKSQYEHYFDLLNKKHDYTCKKDIYNMDNNVLHPDIIKKKSKIGGYGLFASKDIPIGTVIWKCGNVRVYTKKDYDGFSKRYQSILRHFCYEGIDGTLVYCIDNSKYFNHSCDPNTMSIDNEKDITIRDVLEGEELTYDYGYWYLPWNEPFKCNCNSLICRGIIKRELPDSEVIKRLVHKANMAWKAAERKELEKEYQDDKDLLESGNYNDRRVYAR